ncbi:hypothetical protein [Bosea sp. TAF32]|uniref:hypothetical protein n=1 Tax=Bosea sp. TAF32 TaxID=3237482 RepID=UPI003F8FD3EF
MIAKSFIISLTALGASIGAAQATHIDNKALTPVAGLELGERLSKSRAPADVVVAPQAEAMTADADAQPVRAERKVRVVYPLPR